ncbi:MAG TPA: GMC family oxidoreductase [Dehalococcoidia bacterium]|nr:GMC family oxidoreductase [Dehalococcoidia bacterium]
MLIDGRELRPDQVLHADVCVVGAGPAGITLVRELARAKLDVCLLESGGLSDHAPTQRLASGMSKGLPYYPLHRARARAFGGTSKLWFSNIGLRSRPLDPMDFEVRPWIPNSGWPFDKHHLDPYYQGAQSVLGLGPYAYDVPTWETCVTPRLQLDESKLETTIFQLGNTSVFRNQLPELARADNIRVVLNANVLEVEAADDSQMVSSLQVGSVGGQSFRACARVYVLSAGGIENARLLLLSKSRYAAGLGNQHDLVGRYFMEHVHVNSGYIRPTDKDTFPNHTLYSSHRHGSTKLMGALAVTPQVQQSESIGNFSAFLHATSESSASSRGVRSLRQIWQMAREGLWNKSAKDHVRNVLGQFSDVAAFTWRRLTPRRQPDLNELAELGIMSEQVPNRESRVTLAPERDQFGQNKARLDWRLTDQDYRTIVASQGVIDHELRRAGLGTLEAKYADESPRPTFGGGWHHMGTTRMHIDTKQGVVDADCKVHGVSNLYVAGSSVFPTGGFANPTLTIVALALRLAEHLQQALRFPEIA